MGAHFTDLTLSGLEVPMHHTWGGQGSLLGCLHLALIGLARHVGSLQQVTHHTYEYGIRHNVLELASGKRTDAVEVWHGKVGSHACDVDGGSTRPWQALHQHTQVCCGPPCTAIQAPA